jgi:hypothetical protein
MLWTVFVPIMSSGSLESFRPWGASPCSWKSASLEILEAGCDGAADV